MTSLAFTIVPTPPSALKLEVGQRGGFSFTVTCLAAPDKSEEVQLQALLFGADNKASEASWLVAEPRAFTMVGGKTETVTITARPTTKSPPGENTIKLAIADKEALNDHFAYSAPVTCEVITKPGGTTTTKPFPRWLIAAIVGGVVLVGGAFALWKFFLKDPGRKDPDLGEACAPTPAKPCRDGLVCSSGANTCLLPAGAACQEDNRCDSGECVSRLGVCATRIGLACDPLHSDAVPCPRETTCDAVSKTCLKPPVGDPGEVPQPKLQLKTFYATGDVAAHPSARATVDPGYKIVGGGAKVNWSGSGNLLTASYPDGNAWVATSKDHIDPDPASITVWAIALYDPGNEWEVRVFQENMLQPTPHPSVEVAVPSEYVMTGGGAFIHWSGAGNLLTASYPVNGAKWAAASKDHEQSDPATLTAYAIGIRPHTYKGLPKQSIASAVSGKVNHPSSTATAAQGFSLTCGGARVNWTQQGSLLTASYPSGDSWIAAGKDHRIADPATVDAFAIGLKW
jgi:hypothetical protein